MQVSKGLEFIEQKQDSVLHIPVHPECNNFCIFCFESSRDQRREINSQYTSDVVRTILEKNRRITSKVNFSSGEPTLNENLIQYIQWAKELGYTKIGITTNGRKLSYNQYALSIAEAGVTEVVFSLHGHNSKMHDMMTRTKGSFDQIIKGIRNIKELSEYFPIQIVLACVLTQYQLEEVEDLIEHYLSLEPYEIVLNIVQPRDINMEKYFFRVMPQYKDIASKLEDIYRRKQSLFYKNGRRQISIIDLPLCQSHLVRDVIGFGEKRVIENPPLYVEAHKLKDEPRIIFDNDEEKIKLTSCKKCLYDSYCNGVFKNYILNYGHDEFKPILI